MKATSPWKCLILAIIISPTTWQASFSQDIFKCKEANGKLTYQNTPCSSEKQESVNIMKFQNTNTPPERQYNITQPSRTEINDPYYERRDAARREYAAAKKRERECNNRFDELIIKMKTNGADSRHAISIENARTNCIYGNNTPEQTQDYYSYRKNNTGPCLGRCATEQGTCIAQCAGNGLCIANCASSLGRCQSMCSTY